MTLEFIPYKINITVQKAFAERAERSGINRGSQNLGSSKTDFALRIRQRLFQPSCKDKSSTEASTEYLQMLQFSSITVNKIAKNVQKEHAKDSVSSPPFAEN